MTETSFQVSVVMPNRNHGRFVGQALEALLGQSVPPLEVIVVDDGSTDDSVRLIRAGFGTNPRLRLLRHESSQGVFAAVQRGLDACRGDHLYIAAADDWILPGAFERARDLLGAHPQAALCCWETCVYSSRRRRAVPYRLGLHDGPRYFSPLEIAGMYHSGRIGSFIGGGMTLLRRSAFDATGGYLPQLGSACDVFVNLVAMLRGGMCYVPEPYFMNRHDPSSYSGAWNRRPGLRRRVLAHLIALLQSERYRDIYPLVRSSDFLSLFATDAIWALRAAPGAGDLLTSNLVYRALLNKAVQLLSVVLPGDVKRVLVELRNVYHRSRGALRS